MMYKLPLNPLNPLNPVCIYIDSLYWHRNVVATICSIDQIPSWGPFLTFSAYYFEISFNWNSTHNIIRFSLVAINQLEKNML